MIKAKVFISYSHADESHRSELEKRLVMLKRGKFIETWTDRMILPGSEWDRQIKTELNNSDIILLLVSPDFLASDYCFDIEVKHSIEMHESGLAITVPIILRQCDWKTTVFSKLQALPKDAKPLKAWDDIDEYYMNIVEGLKSIISSFNKIQKIAKSEVLHSSFANNSFNANGFSNQEIPQSSSVIEIKIDKNFAEYSDVDQENFLAALKLLLNMDSEVHVSRRMGSVILDIELTPEQAQKLLDLISAGVLDEYKILQASYKNESLKLSLDLNNKNNYFLKKEDREILSDEINKIILKYKSNFIENFINKVDSQIEKGGFDNLITIIERKSNDRSILWKPDSKIEYYNRLMEFRSGANPELDSLFADQVLKMFIEELNMFYIKISPEISEIITRYILSNKELLKEVFPDIFKQVNRGVNSIQPWDQIINYLRSEETNKKKIKNKIFSNVNTIINNNINDLLNDSYRYSQIKGIINHSIKKEISLALGVGLSAIPIIGIPILIGLIASGLSYLSRVKPRFVTKIREEISSTYNEVTNNVSSFIVSDLFNNYMNNIESDISNQNELRELILKIVSEK